MLLEPSHQAKLSIQGTSTINYKIGAPDVVKEVDENIRPSRKGHPSTKCRFNILIKYT